MNNAASKIFTISILHIVAALLSLAGMATAAYMLFVMAPHMGWMAGLVYFPALVALPFMVALLGASMRLLSARVVHWYALLSLIPSASLLFGGILFFPAVAIITILFFMLDRNQRDYEQAGQRKFPYQALVVILSVALPVTVGFTAPQITPYYHSTPGG